MQKKAGIRAYLMGYIAIMGSLCALVVLVSNHLVSHNLSSSRQFFDCIQDLTEFYANVTEMDYHVREYLYERIPGNYQAFEDMLEAAHGNLASIAETVDERTRWRIGRLENMLDYYCAPLTAFEEGRASAYETYNQLYYRKNLITRTADAYYGYLSGYMREMTDAVSWQWTFQRNLQLFLLAAILLLAILGGTLYTKIIYGPICTMVENTRRLKMGEYVLERVDTCLSELDILSESFSEMARSMKENVDTLKEKARLEYALLKQENDNLAMKSLVTEVELHALQAQINPHFLFNTLSMISKSAYISGDVSTSELMEKLSEFLRYALDKADKTSTLYEEIESLKNYLFIQQRRFSAHIQFVLDVEPDIPNIHIPAVVLQPLVENAILHGAGPVTGCVTISVRVLRVQDRIAIHVEDTGAGIPPDMLETLVSSLRLGIQGSSGSIGLSNVYRRLQMYFGSDLQFNIDSEENCGTIVTLVIPVGENQE